MLKERATLREIIYSLAMSSKYKNNFDVTKVFAEIPVKS